MAPSPRCYGRGKLEIIGQEFAAMRLVATATAGCNLVFLQLLVNLYRFVMCMMFVNVKMLLYYILESAVPLQFVSMEVYIDLYT